MLFIANQKQYCYKSFSNLRFDHSRWNFSAFARDLANHLKNHEKSELHNMTFYLMDCISLMFYSIVVQSERDVTMAAESSHIFFLTD